MDKAQWIHAVLDKYEGTLTRYAYRVTQDLERAREVVQETFLKLWQAERSDVEGHLAEWLFTVCRNQALDVRRKDKRMLPLAEPVEEATEETPSRLLETHQQKVEIMTAFTMLPARQQEVLRLKFQNELSYQEISRITGLSVSNVGFIIHAAIKKLRAQLSSATAVATTLTAATFPTSATSRGSVV
jgi:RNA polymerase sigma-70 factor (ECF subfamily)